MESQVLLLTFRSVDGRNISFEVSDPSGNITVTCNRDDMHFTFEGQNHLSDVLTRNQFQLEKVIRSALKGKPEPGQQIQFLFIENFTFLNNRDYQQYIRIDRRSSKLAISVSTKETTGIPKLYTDGSYSKESNLAGYAGMIVNSTDNSLVFHASVPGGSSNLMELMAVTEGLKRLGPVEQIQINTDSRFVIRGLAQWIYFWRLNNWLMAYGRKVRYAEQWQLLDKLSEGKFLELKWIKGHSGDRNQEFCHRLAKEMATSHTPRL